MKWQLIWLLSLLPPRAQYCYLHNATSSNQPCHLWETFATSVLLALLVSSWLFLGSSGSFWFWKVFSAPCILVQGFLNKKFGTGHNPPALVFILSVFIWDLQCKNHFNRKMVFRVTKSQSIKDKLSFIWYNMIILTGGGVWGVWGVVGGLRGQYTCVFRRSECKWVQISQRKRSQNLHGQPNYGWPSKFFFSYMENGPGGIFWPKRDNGVHLEHPEKVVFMTERGRKRVKEWRDATCMKE